MLRTPAPPSGTSTCSPWPMVMPPDSVPVLLETRLLEIWMPCAQACTKMPPPPCELLVTPSPSMLDGLQRKLLGYGLATKSAPPSVPRPQSRALPVRSVVPSGNLDSVP